MASSVSPAGVAEIGQIVYPAVAVYAGEGGRAVRAVVVVSVTMLDGDGYARRLIKNPNKSLMNTTSWQKHMTQSSNDEMNIQDRLINWRDVVVVSLVIFTPIILAVGNGMIKWTEKYGNGVFITVFVIRVLI